MRSSATFVQFQFPVTDADEVRAVEAAARGEGFRAETGERLFKNDNVAAEAGKLLVVLDEYGPKALAVAAGIKTALEIPDTVRKLREKLRPYLKNRLEISPELQLPVVEGWLDRAYGQGGWRVSRNRVIVRPFWDGLLLFVVPEETSGKAHLLVVDGDEIEELPESFLSPAST